MAGKMRILSIDGGGIRGLIPAAILAELEQMLIDRSGNPQARLMDHFDLVAGTSTGGLIACLLLLPDPDSPDPEAPQGLRSARDVVDFYQTNAFALFKRSTFQKVRRTGAILDERYGSKGIREVLDDTLGRDLRNQPKLADLIRPTVIPTWDATSSSPYFFKQHMAREVSGLNFPVRSVALATSAAPTVFETAEVLYQGQARACVDGGVFASNPAMCAYAEAHSHFGLGAKDMAILSLGTGRMSQSFTHKQMRNWGVARWVKPVLDMMMEGSARTVDYQVRQIFSTLGESGQDQYLRLQPVLSGAEPAVAKMDNVKPKNLQRLISIGKEQFDRDRAALERFVDTQLL